MHSMSSIAMMPLSRTEGRIETTCSGMAATPLLDRHRELLLDFLAEVRPRVVCAERDDLAVGRRVMDDTALDALDVVVVVVLEVHATDVHRRPGELRGTGLFPLSRNRYDARPHAGCDVNEGFAVSVRTLTSSEIGETNGTGYQSSRVR